MEKNCLVTKYKATVNDNSLLKVGEMFIDIIEQASPTNKTNSFILYNNAAEDVVYEVENGEANLTLDSNMESGWTNKITVPASSFPSAVYVRNGNYRVKAFPKYTLTQVGIYGTSHEAISIDTKYLKYSKNITKIYCCLSGDIVNLIGLTDITNLGFDSYNYSNLTGKLSDLALITSLKTVVLHNCSCTGTLSDLVPLTSLTDLDLAGINISSDISEVNLLSSLRNLKLNMSPNISGNIKDLRVPLTHINVDQTKVTGDLVEFVKTQRAAGRTSGSLTSDYWGIKIKFNGNYISGNKKLTWTENTITCGDNTIEM